jgi:glycosyltransferase involved in cell wall biosynthesis
MRIGLVHNYYRSTIPSGENLTVTNIAKILREMNHDVRELSDSSDKYFLNWRNKVGYFQNNLKRFEDSALVKELREVDAVQVHQAFPLLRIHELGSILQLKIPVTRVIHNYRKTCIAGSHFYQKQECFRCQRNFLPGIARSCYNENLLQSLYVSKYQRALNVFDSNENVSFIAISSQIKNYLIEIGITADRITLIENSVEEGKIINRLASEVLFVGRLEYEKGILQVVRVWRKHPLLPMLNIVGDGSLKKEISSLTAGISNVTFHGPATLSRIQEIAMYCKISLTPALWREPFGRTLAESLSRGQFIISTLSSEAIRTIRQGINGLLIEDIEKDLAQSVFQGLRVMHEIHSSVSRNLWRKFYSSEIIKQKWRRYYEKLEEKS